MARDRDVSGAPRFLAGFALLSLAAVALGCAVAAAHGVSTGSWARNPAAWLVGAALAWGAVARASRLAGFLIAAPMVLAATLLGAGREGVHRWIALGPLNVNAALLLVPAAVVALAVLGDRRWAWGAAAAMLGILVLQPDASQATALGAAMVVVLASLRVSAIVRAGGIAATVAAVVVAWTRRDPLEPVAEVEGIVALAWGWSPAAGVAAVALLVAVVLLPLTLVRRAPTPALALAACCAVQAIAPAIGAFPVPLMGMGMSSVLGLWLGAGALAAAARTAAPAADASHPPAATG